MDEASKKLKRKCTLPSTQSIALAVAALYAAASSKFSIAQYLSCQCNTIQVSFVNMNLYIWL